jgi:hypothetical protein
VQDGPATVPALHASRSGASGYRLLMRVIFTVYLLVIVAGLTYFTVIGLTHH